MAGRPPKKINRHQDAISEPPDLDGGPPDGSPDEPAVPPLQPRQPGRPGFRRPGKLPAGRPGGGARRTPNETPPKTPRRKRPRGLHLIFRPMSGNIYQLHGTYLRVRVRESTGETDLDRAELYRARRVREIQESRDNGGKPKHHSFWEACDLYMGEGITKKYLIKKQHTAGTLALIKKVQKAVGPGVFCDDIDDDFLEEIAEQIIRPDSQPISFKRQVQTPVKSVLMAAHRKWGNKQGCPHPSFSPIPDNKGRDVAVPPHISERMIAIAEARGLHCCSVVMQLGLCEGPRRSELYGAMWQFIDLGRRTIVLRDTKDPLKQVKVRDRRISDVRPRALQALERYRRLTGATSGRVFVQDDLEPWSSLGAFGRYINGCLRELAAEAGFPDPVTLHVLRHSAATMMSVSGAHIDQVRERMDWKDFRTTERYIHRDRMPGTSPGEVFDFWGLAQK